jgi:hypothetical protein
MQQWRLMIVMMLATHHEGTFLTRKSSIAIK